MSPPGIRCRPARPAPPTPASRAPSSPSAASARRQPHVARRLFSSTGTGYCDSPAVGEVLDCTVGWDSESGLGIERPPASPRTGSLASSGAPSPIRSPTEPQKGPYGARRLPGAFSWTSCFNSSAVGLPGSLCSVSIFGGNKSMFCMYFC